jgi:hypothetical protein
MFVIKKILINYHIHIIKHVIGQTIHVKAWNFGCETITMPFTCKGGHETINHINFVNFCFKLFF